MKEYRGPPERDNQMPPEERHYIAIAKIETQVDSIKEFLEEQKDQNRREHDAIVKVLDDIRVDMSMCPHTKIEQTELDIKDLKGSVKSIVVFGSTILGGIVVGAVITLLRTMVK